MSTDLLSSRLDRRTAIKWMLTAVASAAVFDRDALSAESTASAAKGYGTDPDLLKDYKPGDLWPLTFDVSQRATAGALCDLIIPADAKSPAASALGVHEFIDEWISAPYPGHPADRAIVVGGLGWLEAESQRRFQTSFVALPLDRKTQIGEDICFVAKAKPEFKTGAQFFKRFRDLTAGGFYTTREGMRDIGYTGNVPLATFDGPPVEALKQLGLV